MIRRKEIGNNRLGIVFRELGGCRVDDVKIAKIFEMCKRYPLFFSLILPVKKWAVFLLDSPSAICAKPGPMRPAGLAVISSSYGYILHPYPLYTLYP